ncbi:MAG: DUF669 domain-containing protein [Planctomycetes bacterium]|nr:DUF669 domain-containing protein [Planctomycetota bacterium]
MNTHPNPFDASEMAPQERTDPSVDLSALDGEYAKVEAAEVDEIPDGKYQARVHSVRLTKSQSGNPMLQFDLVILTGAHAGRHLFKNSVFTPAALPFFKADLKVLGLDVPKLSDLPKHLDAMLDVSLEVTKRTKGEYANLYFNKRLQIPAGIPPADGIAF